MPIVTTGTKQKGGGGWPEDHIPTGMEPAIKNATEDVLPARAEDLAGAGVAKRSSAVLGVGTTLGADHQFTTVEKVVTRGVHARGREGTRALAHMEAPDAAIGGQGAAHLDRDVPQTRENLQRNLREGDGLGTMGGTSSATARNSSKMRP